MTSEFQTDSTTLKLNEFETLAHILLDLSVSMCVSEGSGSVKSGGGGNAREIRIRKTKKKGRREEDSDEETGTTQQGNKSNTPPSFSEAKRFFYPGHSHAPKSPELTRLVTTKFTSCHL